MTNILNTRCFVDTKRLELLNSCLTDSWRRGYRVDKVLFAENVRMDYTVRTQWILLSKYALPLAQTGSFWYRDDLGQLEHSVEKAFPGFFNCRLAKGASANLTIFLAL
jgi:hypothetical protein